MNTNAFLSTQQDDITGNKIPSGNIAFTLSDSVDVAVIAPIDKPGLTFTLMPCCNLVDCSVEKAFTRIMHDGVIYDIDHLSTDPDFSSVMKISDKNIRDEIVRVVTLNKQTLLEYWQNPWKGTMDLISRLVV